MSGYIHSIPSGTCGAVFMLPAREADDRPRNRPALTGGAFCLPGIKLNPSRSYPEIRTASGPCKGKVSRAYRSTIADTLRWMFEA
jgi:hypothetical protein